MRKKDKGGERDKGRKKTGERRLESKTDEKNKEVKYRRKDKTGGEKT